jgi:hypothetical protein
MAVVGIRWVGWSGGAGYHFTDINMAPSAAGVQVALRGTTGAGTQFAGIKHFRRRRPDGSDEDVDFGEWPTWRSNIFEPNLTSITCGVANGTDQIGWGVARVDFWQ